MMVRKAASAMAVVVALAAPVMSGARDKPAADTIQQSTVLAHMEFLASDAMNGRGSGTRDEWITATYIASQLRRYGLQPLGDAGGYVQTVDVLRTEVAGSPSLTVGPIKIDYGDLLIRSLPAASVHGALQKYHANTPVHPGAALLMPADAPPGRLPNLNAAAVLLWHETPAQRERWMELTKQTSNVGRAKLGGIDAAQAPVSAPAQFILADSAYAMVDKQPEGVTVEMNATTRDTASHTWNAVGRLAGSGKQAGADVILLTAHLDHLGARETGTDKIFNGADDDASGSIAVLILAEALAKGPPLARSVVFAWFGSEEAGGYGARYFVDKPTIPLASIAANLEFEMIGRPDASIAPHTLWLTGWERTNLGPQLAQHGARLVPDPHPKENFFSRSDNITLARRGVVAQTVSSFGLHADYHQPSDEISRIDFAHMTESIQSLLAPIRWLADSTFKPDWVSGGRPE